MHIVSKLFLCTPINTSVLSVFKPSPVPREENSPHYCWNAHFPDYVKDSYLPALADHPDPRVEAGAAGGREHVASPPRGGPLPL